MSSELYARYDPVMERATLSAAHSTTENTTLDARPVADATTQQDASSTYNRYIPPSKDTSRSTNQPVHIPVRESPRLSRAKRKRTELGSQYGKAGKKLKDDEAWFGAEEVSEPLVDDGSWDSDQGLILKRLRKNKRPNVEDGGSKAPDEEHGEDLRHQKLLEKRERSIRKAERIARKEARRNPKNVATPEDIVAMSVDDFHDLVPIPQPKPILEPHSQSIVSSLPPWLASPIRVAPSASADFGELGVQPEIVTNLRNRGFKAAFAVQAAVLPLLLPTYKGEPGDVLVSAATGSGKTLSYVLPMIEEISRTTVTQLRGLIVLPTRELVAQAREVCELCASAFSTGNRKRVKIGTAVGSVAFKEEQLRLIEQILRYDPGGYKEREPQLNSKWESSDLESDGEYNFFCEDDIVPKIPEHVIDHVSKVDIIICTPGRLVEHIKSTPGFSLTFVTWIVVDEADKLLDQSYQQWLDTLLVRIQDDADSPRKLKGVRVRKVVLSATMTMDIGQLANLRLYRPNMVVLEGSNEIERSRPPNIGNPQSRALPPLLVEFAVKIDNESVKPLCLLELLNKESLIPGDAFSAKSPILEECSDEALPRETSSSLSSNESDSAKAHFHGTAREQYINDQKGFVEPEAPRGVLIFTKSNETAVRLGRLLSILSPSISNVLGILTSTTRSSKRRATLQAFERGKISILVASDLVSRGLDLPNLAHVINYDIPTSVTNYLHRVGRTARAGKRGIAWTLFTSSEARWFWNDVARSQSIDRQEGRKVARANLSAENIEDNRMKYEQALEILRREASGNYSKKDANAT